MGRQYVPPMAFAAVTKMLSSVLSSGMWYVVESITVEPPVATTTRKRPPLLSDQFSKLPKVCESNHYIWNLL